MTPTTQELVAPLSQNVQGEGAKQMLDMLCGLGLIDRRAAEAFHTRREMERLVRSGTPRCRAMHIIADRLCCSYEKVRAIVYAREQGC